MSTITKDLGAVTAYAYAKEKGYTGTEAEFAELMASYATVAEQASQSAQTATEKAQQASASATSASQSADTASASATSAQAAQQTATAKASEAQQSAQTATTKAQEASQSASTASQKAQEASQSATDAESAKTASETAQASAESARDDAESARDEAQQYAESIDPQKLIGAYPVDTASGSIASFIDGADNIPMKSVKVRIEPVQDLSKGDPSPDNICPISGWDSVAAKQAGKNLWKFDKAYSASASGSFIPIDVSREYMLKAGTYTLSFDALSTINAIQFNFIYVDDTQAQVTYSIGTSQGTGHKAYTFTLTQDVKLLRNAYCNTAFSIDNFMIEAGFTATAYEPYSGNSIPISLPQTVYGGTLDVITGELVVDRAMIASYNGETLPSEWISDRDKYVAGATPTTGAQVIYKLSQAVTLTLSPTEVRSLLGENNVWADAGDSTVTYRADTALYINRKIAEAVSALS